ncbi:MAG: TMEM43 family protein [Akkermansia sp.]
MNQDKYYERRAEMIGGGIGRAIFPPLLLIACIMGIFISENSYDESLTEQGNLMQNLITITDIDNAPRKDCEGKPVYIKGALNCSPIEDGALPLVFKGMVLSREVQQYEKIEKDVEEVILDDQGNKRRVSKRVPSYEWVKSKRTKEDNIDLEHLISVGSESPKARLDPYYLYNYCRISEKIYIGEFPISDELRFKLSKELKKQLIAPTLPTSIIPEKWENRAFVTGNVLYLRLKHDVKAAGKPLSKEDVQEPQEGDVMISWAISKPNLTATAIALYKDGVLDSNLRDESEYTKGKGILDSLIGFIEYNAQHEFSTIFLGDKNKEELVGENSISTSNIFQRNFLYFCGIMIGCAMLLMFPIGLLERIPFLAPFLGIGKVAASIVGAILGLLICVIVVVLTWILNLPLWGILLLISCFLAIYFILKKRRKQN